MVDSGRRSDLFRGIFEAVAPRDRPASVHLGDAPGFAAFALPWLDGSLVAARDLQSFGCPGNRPGDHE